MPRSNMLRLTCDFCSHAETFDQSVPESMAPVKIHKWRQVASAADPAIPNRDTSRWYDSLDCLRKGEERQDREFEESLIAAKVNRKPVLMGVDTALPAFSKGGDEKN